MTGIRFAVTSSMPLRTAADEQPAVAASASKPKDAGDTFKNSASMNVARANPPSEPSVRGFPVLSGLAPQFDPSSAQLLSAQVFRDGGSVQVTLEDAFHQSLTVSLGAPIPENGDVHVAAPEISMKVTPEGFPFPLPRSATLGAPAAREVAQLLETVRTRTKDAAVVGKVGVALERLKLASEGLPVQSIQRGTVPDPAASVSWRQQLNFIDFSTLKRVETTDLAVGERMRDFSITDVQFVDGKGARVLPDYTGTFLTVVTSDGKGAQLTFDNPESRAAVLGFLGGIYANSTGKLKDKSYDSFLAHRYADAGSRPIARVPELESEAEAALYILSRATPPDLLEALAADVARHGKDIWRTGGFTDALITGAAAIRGYALGQNLGTQPSPLSAIKGARGSLAGLGGGLTSRVLDELLQALENAQRSGRMPADHVLPDGTSQEDLKWALRSSTSALRNFEREQARQRQADALR